MSFIARVIRVRLRVRLRMIILPVEIGAKHKLRGADQLVVDGVHLACTQ